MQSYSENDFFDKIEDLTLQKYEDGTFFCRITKPHVCDGDLIDIQDVGDEVRFEKLKPKILLFAKKFLAILKTVLDYTEKNESGLKYDVGGVYMEDDTHFVFDMWQEDVNNQFDVYISYKDGVFIFENFNNSVDVGTVVEQHKMKSLAKQIGFTIIAILSLLVLSSCFAGGKIIKVKKETVRKQVKLAEKKN